MVADARKPNVQDLQRDVIDLLAQISSLMGRASTALRSEETGKKYAEFQKQVAAEASKVENLELRMAIVAPMKAGKSTIINAIVGQDLLPSRNAAMTTLPTEIVFNAEVTEPSLKLSDEILSVFTKTVEALRHKILTSEPDWIRERVSHYPHLMDLLHKIQELPGLLIRTEISGFEEIKNTLTELNDIIRLCSLLEPSKDPLGQLMDIPRIETPFWRSQKTAQSEKIGNLVIVDTPGPNEAGEHLKLAAVVAHQLWQSSIVLIVLDFTQLKTKAAEEVKQDVQKVIELRGKENLYVLINKVDQRSDNDMTPDQVRQFVATEFGIGDSDDTDRVFEIAARGAFCATNFQLELQQHPEIDIAEMKTVRALAQQALGSRWEAKLKKASVEDLQEEAEYLWQTSGFVPFLDKAINALIENAAPRCMESALNISLSHLVELRNQALIRSSDIAKDAEKLQRQIEAIEEDLRYLELCRSRLQQVDTIKTQLQQTLNELLKALQDKAKVTIEDYFGEAKYQRGNLLEKFDMEARKIFMTNIGSFQLFPEWISQRIKSQIEIKSSGLIEFKSDREAENFVELAFSYAKHKMEILIEKVRENSRNEVDRSTKELIDFLKIETKEIIERARTRLDKAFYIDLSPPPLPEWDMEIDRYLHGAYVNRRTRQINKEQKIKERPWYFLWLIEIEKTVPIVTKEGYYVVLLENIVNAVNESIEENIDNIHGAINKYLDEDFKQRIDAFFNGLDRYFSNYRDSLKQAQEDQKLKADEKEKLVAELKSIVPDATKQINKADTYLKHTAELMVDK